MGPTFVTLYVVSPVFHKNGGWPCMSVGNVSFDISVEIDCEIPNWKLGPRFASCLAETNSSAALKLCPCACCVCASSQSCMESLSARVDKFAQKLCTFQSPCSGTSHTTNAILLLRASADSATCACCGTRLVASDSQPSGLDKSV